jgi:hypothetical protein
MTVECGNCGKVSDESELTHPFPDIPDLTQRIEPGEPVPFGECPECGALVHAIRETFMCRLCAEVVKAENLRNHMIEHNPNAEGMDWEDIRNQFTLLSAQGNEPKKVVVTVRGGVAEVAYCPKGITVEIRDYDTDGWDGSELEKDGAWVGTFEGNND